MKDLDRLICEAMNLGGTPTCAAGHDWQSDGGRRCPHDADSCSQTAYVCARCGEVDYGYKGGPGWDDCKDGGCSREAEEIVSEQRHQPA